MSVVRWAPPAIGAGLLPVVLDGRWWWAAVRALVAVLLVVALDRTRGGLRRPGLAPVPIALGVAAVAGGAALALSYGRHGPGVRAAGGVLCVVGGLLLVASGAAALGRATRGWRRILVVPLVLVVAYAAGVPVGIAVFATNVGRPPLPAATPADHGLEHLDVALVTEDGVRLDGWYVPSRTGAAVAVLHGASSTRAAVLDQAVVLARHGYGVLLFDARGMGTSGGRAMNLGWAGDADVHAAVDFLAARPDVDPDRIAVLGESMGGEEAIGAMASDPRIRAVVAEGATHRAADDWTWLPDRYGWRGRVQLGVHRLTTALTDVLTDERPPTALRAAVAAAERPVLLITAGEVADEAAAEHIRTGAPERVQVWTVPGAAHTGGLATAPGEWQRQVTAFLDASLDPPAG